MVRVHDKYRGVRTMVDNFFLKDKSVLGGGGYQDMTMNEAMAAFDN